MRALAPPVEHRQGGTGELTASAERERGTRRHHSGAGAGRRGGKDTVSTELPHTSHSSSPDLTVACRYKIGDSFFHVTVLQAQGMLETSTARIEEDVSQLEDKLSTAREEMTQLKVELYARFGRSINLET